MSFQDPPLCTMEFVKDAQGNEMLLKDGTHQVMMEWERPYMEACIEALEPTGDVLEIGFGCGYSARAIQKFSPKSHTIIEYHPVVARKALEWAKDFPNVRIIEDTWQNALGKLGVFDQIFFDDYPLESQKQQLKLIKSKQKASWVLSKGKEALQKIKQKFSFLETIQYKDEDLDYFICEIKKRKGTKQEHFLPFFYDLKNKNQITQEQYQATAQRLQQELLIDAATAQAFEKKLAEKELVPVESRGDRFWGFLQTCLKSHMRLGSRFSCYLEHPVSRYEDEEFTQQIILNPELDFHENWIDVSVPAHCKYYQGSEALVMVITKKK